jgi:hypothetical protein
VFLAVSDFVTLLHARVDRVAGVPEIHLFYDELRTSVMAPPWAGSQLLVQFVCLELGCDHRLGAKSDCAAAPECLVCTATSVSVASIELCLVQAGGGARAGVADATIQDDCGDPVSGVTVEGEFAEDINELAEGDTVGGVATIHSVGTVLGTGDFMVCVLDVTGGLPYDPAGNGETCDSY